MKNLLSSVILITLINYGCNDTRPFIILQEGFRLEFTNLNAADYTSIENSASYRTSYLNIKDSSTISVMVNYSDPCFQDYSNEDILFYNQAHLCSEKDVINLRLKMDITENTIVTELMKIYPKMKVSDTINASNLIQYWHSYCDKKGRVFIIVTKQYEKFNLFSEIKWFDKFRELKIVNDSI